MKKITFPISVFIAAVTFYCSNGFAEIYKRVDSDGRITYSNSKTKGATRLDLDPDVNNITDDNRPKSTNNNNSNNSANKRISTPTAFPKVDKETQDQRDDKRLDILQSELDAERLALLEAKKAYVEAESKPEVYRKKNLNGTVSTFRNVPKFDEKMKNLQAEIDSHQNNIELLQKELNSLR